MRAVLLYSAAVRDELLFAPELDAMAAAAPHGFRTIYTTTQEADAAGEGAEGSVRSGRVSAEMLGEAVSWLGEAPHAVYVCGPPGMSEAMCDAAAEHGVPREAVHFEQWW